VSTVACDAGISFEDYRNPRHDLSEMIYARFMNPRGPLVAPSLRVRSIGMLQPGGPRLSKSRRALGLTVWFTENCCHKIQVYTFLVYSKLSQATSLRYV